MSKSKTVFNQTEVINYISKEYPGLKISHKLLKKLLDDEGDFPKPEYDYGPRKKRWRQSQIDNWALGEQTKKGAER